MLESLVLVKIGACDAVLHWLHCSLKLCIPICEIFLLTRLRVMAVLPVSLVPYFSQVRPSGYLVGRAKLTVGSGTLNTPNHLGTLI